MTHGLSDIVLFNPKDWSLFIGTAIFTFEGIGLIIPITQSMKEPEKFPAVLGGVMIFITILFTSMGALSYAAFGSSTKTVILSNLNQHNKFVNAVQLLYSLAILLSTPLQLFPAIRILETAVFTKSGKYNPTTKWAKNLFRVIIVILSTLIAWIGADDLDKFVSLVLLLRTRLSGLTTLDWFLCLRSSGVHLPADAALPSCVSYILPKGG